MAHAACIVTASDLTARVPEPQAVLAEPQVSVDNQVTTLAEVHAPMFDLPLPSGAPPAKPPPPSERELSEEELVDDNNNGEQSQASLYKERIRRVRELMDLTGNEPIMSKDVCMSLEAPNTFLY